jgi:hypothetical protein
MGRFAFIGDGGLGRKSKKEEVLLFSMKGERWAMPGTPDLG